MSGSRVEREAGLLANLPVAIALIAEAAWIAVFAGLLEALVLHPPVTGIPELFLAAVAGTVAARTLPARVGEAWSRLAVALAAVAGLAGWLASAEVWALLLAGGEGALGRAIAANPGGWLAALAFVRGIAHARLPVDPGRVGTVLAVSVPGLALAAVLGGMISEPARSAFLAAAQAQVLVFLAASVLALALARLANVGRGARVDWRRNPPWIVLSGALVLLTAGIAAWVSLNAGHAIATALAVTIVPLLIVGFVVGFDRRSLRILLISLATVGVLGTILRIVAPNGPPATPGPAPLPPSIPGDQAAPDTTAALWVLALLLALAVGAVLVLARLWLRRARRETPADDEVRVIDRGGLTDVPRRPARRPLLRRRARPADAVAAYRALLADLDGRRPVAREPGETPSEHARRLRGAGHGALGLELLAADYGLARFGDVALTEAETRRAIGRADRLRTALLRVPVEALAEEGSEAGRLARRPSDGPAGKRGSRHGGGPGADLPDADEPGETGSILNRIRRGP
ncbi:MAG TPA: DUF4129 domain-containing protein [Candidatus Limnocylindrales bacterium]|nr:DUF4129 domain-containing protein [Candidatus Limnocylindrales bacterium]